MLPKENRLKKKKEFEAIFENGRTIKGRNIIVKYLGNGLGYAKVGFIVSKKVSKKAVERNKIKRQLREVVKKTDLKRGLSIIIIALSSIKGVPYSEIESDIEKTLKL
ncbi:MAG: ribonuclease P protein component [Candidatus Pacebacteria bacterium]|nr:ribonuclease P protein component [Candidatus Paceibacterota bacterium]